MKLSLHKLPSILSIISLGLLTACGGGGGDNAPQGKSEITIENASTVAAEMLSAGESLEYSSTFAPFGAVSSATVSESVTRSKSADAATGKLINISLEHVNRMRKNGALNTTAITPSATESCPAGGSVSYSSNVANPNTDTVGDSVSATFNNCRNSDQSVLNGGFKATLTQVGSSGFGVQIVYKNFSLVAPDLSVKFNGDLAVRSQDDGSGNESYSITGNSLQMSGAYQGSTYFNQISSFNHAIMYGASLFTFRTNFTMFGDVPSLGSNVQYTVKTNKEFKENYSESFPHAGELVVTATNKSNLKLTVLDNTSVQIDVDTDGNGTIDNSMIKTWAELYS